MATRTRGRTRTSYEARTIRSRFTNRCYACGGSIQVGDLIIWSPSRRGEARHANCHSVNQTEVITRESSANTIRAEYGPAPETRARANPPSARPTPDYRNQSQSDAYSQESGFVVRAITKTKVEVTQLNLRCPYCRDFFQSISGLVKCDQCLTHYHRDCFEQNRKCTVLGCSGSISADQNTRIHQPEITIEPPSISSSRRLQLINFFRIVTRPIMWIVVGYSIIIIFLGFQDNILFWFQLLAEFLLVATLLNSSQAMLLTAKLLFRESVTENEKALIKVTWGGIVFSGIVILIHHWPRSS